MRKVLLAAALLGVAACGSAAGDPEQRHSVQIREFAYEPSDLTVAPGDTVVWTNHDVVPHTVTRKDGGLDSGSIAAGASWTFVVDQAGEVEYLCIYHPTMTGRIEVR